MWFPAVLAASALITIASIFTVYKVYLEKPQETQVPVVARQASPLPSNEAIVPAPAVSPSEKPTVPKISAAPKPSDKKIIVLQNNTGVNSSANPSPSTGSSVISGTINLVGNPPSGSSLVIAARPTDSGEQFKVILDGITAQNNASWSWSQAQDGVRYDLFAVLKGKSGAVDIDYASSPPSTVKAPYQGQVFIVDGGYTLSAPTGSATVSCTTHLSNNSWNTTVTYPAVTGAKMYHIQIGTTSGGNDLLDTTLDAQSVSPNLKDSTNYYFRYSVASVSNPTAYQYSSYSSASTIRCP